MTIAALILGALLALAFAAAGGSKLAGIAAMRASARSLGFSFTTYRAIGLLELFGAIGLIVGMWRGQPAATALGVAAAIGLAVLMLGAVGTHLRAGDKQLAPPLVLAVLSAGYVALLSTGA